MNKTDFTTILKKPQHIYLLHTENLKNVINAFPYFQPARALHLKGLKNDDDFEYNNALKATAAYTTDRNILFNFITSDTFEQKSVTDYIIKNVSHISDIDVIVQDISSNKTVTIDQKLKQEIESTKGILDPNLFQPKISTNQIANLTNSIPSTTENKDQSTTVLDKKAATPKEILNIGKPLQFNKNEKHSFQEWLTLAQFKPINRNVNYNENTSEEKNNALARAKKFDLIEKFIEKSPKLSAKKDAASKHNIAKAQMIQPEALMTETLARIYLEQKNYKKAIQSYKILSLKYPEKSGFFADQIKAIKELQEQNNKE